MVTSSFVGDAGEDGDEDNREGDSFLMTGVCCCCCCCCDCCDCLDCWCCCRDGIANFESLRFEMNVFRLWFHVDGVWFVSRRSPQW